VPVYQDALQHVVMPVLFSQKRQHLAGIPFKQTACCGRLMVADDTYRTLSVALARAVIRKHSLEC